MTARRLGILHCCYVSTLIGLVLGLAVAAPGRPLRAATPVVLDTDIGDDIDDTWALATLLNSPELDIRLVTTTHGKAEYRAKIIAKLLSVAKRTAVPVGLGEGGHGGTGGQEPWVRDYRLSDYPGPVRQDGAAALAEVIEHSPQPITVIAIGPLETVAAVLERRPELAAKAAFVGMQGSVRKGYGGKQQPDREWNVVANVAAARRVLSAPWRQIAITPLDTCGLVTLAGERFERLKHSQSPLAQAVLENYRIWSNKPRLADLHSSSVLFDTAAIYLAYPGDRPLMKLETLNIAVTPDGFTRIDPAGRSMSVATDWTSLDGYRDFLVKTLDK
ncbi:MAG: nucleoside hydrolase [Thermoguttaceae bacterium]|jgi:inosine-uridine nucleoside N-ribohydrolase